MNFLGKSNKKDEKTHKKITTGGVILGNIYPCRLGNTCTVYVQENDVKVEITEIKGNLGFSF